MNGRELREQAPEKLDEADEQDLEQEDVEEENEAAGGELPAWLRSLGIVLVFLIVGPPLGGYTLLAIIFVMGVIDHGINWARLSEAFAGAVFFTAVFSYVFGGILAILTGVMVATSSLSASRKWYC